MASNMQALGIRRTRNAALAYNGFRNRTRKQCRRDLYREKFDELLAENGPIVGEVNEMKDGWALDTSRSLPGIDELIAESEQIIAERGLKATKRPDTYRAFFQNIAKPEDTEKYPSILNFVLSSSVLATVCQYMETIPVLSGTLPPGIRLAESSAAFDSAPKAYRDSQLFHLDYYSAPMVYVIVLLRDISAKSGPFRWVPISESEAAVSKLKYWEKGTPYRLSDETFYSAVDPKSVRELAYPKGTVLFIDPSRCFHYGSRDAVIPRYQMMYGFSPVCRTDLSELTMEPLRYHLHGKASRLRQMVLRPDCLPE
jgi:hypothetical protein